MSGNINSHEYIELNDAVSLHIRDWGQGTPIVFIPGWPFGHEMFEYQFTQLPQQGYRCIGISMRGFGKSSKPWGEYTYDVFADDLQSVLQSLDLRNVTLVGFSMGGAIALRYLARHKEDRVVNLVLSGVAAPGFTGSAITPDGSESVPLDTLLKLCSSDRAKLNADLGALFFKNSYSVSPQLLDWFQSLGMEASPHATAACLATIRNSDLRDDIRSVKIPTVIFHGLNDQITPFKRAETMTSPAEVMPTSEVAMAAGAETIAAAEEPAARGIQGAKLICFENSGHALFYEERDKFNMELINFIEKKAPTGKEFFAL